MSVCLSHMAFLASLGVVRPARAGDKLEPAGVERWSMHGDLCTTPASRSSTSSTSVRLARAPALGLAVDRGLGQLHHLFARREANPWRLGVKTDWTTSSWRSMGVGARSDQGGGRRRSRKNYSTRR